MVDALPMQCKLTHLIPRGACKYPLPYYLRTVRYRCSIYVFIVSQ